MQTENLHLRGRKSSNAPDGLVTAILFSAVSADMFDSLQERPSTMQRRVLHLIIWEGCAQRNQMDGAKLYFFVSQMYLPMNEILGHLWSSVNCSGKV